MEIVDVLSRIKACVSQNLITFKLDNSQERAKNKDFIDKYFISSNERVKIINNLTIDNFCEVMSERRKDSGKYSNLYVFGTKKKLIGRENDQESLVEIYIKVQFMKLQPNCEYVLVVSFHEAEKQLRYFSR